ncbi:c-type cytochrome [Neisseria animaloris]|uniref:c-type cytochrome n=1 Tax=Neisseria animaloris TaxID=326522 RepID=UPI0039E0812D
MNQLNNNKAQGSALTTLLGGIVILLAVLFFLVKLATSGYYSDVEESTQSAIETRITPVGKVTQGDGVAVGQRTGDKIFEKICIQCHAADSNVPNAPRITNNSDWAPRIAQGFEAMFNNALNGFNAMPAKGGAADLTDDELKRAIAHMVNQSGGKFEAPAVGGAAAAPAADNGSESSPAVSAPAVDGQKVFESACMACHNANSAIPNVPRITNNDDWAPRIKQGKEILFKHAIEGFTGKEGGVMPPKGGNPGLSDDEVKAAVIYMVNQSGGKFEASAGAAAAAPAAKKAAKPESSPAVSEAEGKKIFESVCMVCHNANSLIPNVPRITNNADWAPRIKQGKEILFKHAIEGFTGKQGGVMPPKGGNSSLSDDEVKAAVTYMVNQSGGKI